MAAKNVLVYADKGAGIRSVVTTIQALQRNLHSVEVKPILASEVVQGSWKDSSVLLVMPGGADLPYCKALNGAGNEHIRGTLLQFFQSNAEHPNIVEQHSMAQATPSFLRVHGNLLQVCMCSADFIEQGGAYLGLCAGAYYAAGYVCFGRGTPLHVEGQRELELFPGTALGSVAPAFDYASEAGAQATPVTVCAESRPFAVTSPHIVHTCAPHSTTAGQHAATSMNEVAECVGAETPAERARVDSCAAVEHSHSQQRDNFCCQQEGNGQAPHGKECSSAILPEDTWLPSPTAAAQEQQSGCFLPRSHLKQQPRHAPGAMQGPRAHETSGHLQRATLQHPSDEKLGGGGLPTDRVSDAGSLEQFATGCTVAEPQVAEGTGSQDHQHGQVESVLRGRADLLTSLDGSLSSCELQKGSCVVDYVNGGCCFLVHGPAASAPKEAEGSEAPRASMEGADVLGTCMARDGVTVVARYEETGRIAAVATRPFGEHAGRAVLCGTHPEMPGEVLLAGTHLEPPTGVRGSLGAARYTQHLMQLHKRLLGGNSDTFGENERRREAYFRLLLQHAGLQEFLTVAVRS